MNKTVNHTEYLVVMILTFKNDFISAIKLNKIVAYDFASISFAAMFYRLTRDRILKFSAVYVYFLVTLDKLSYDKYKCKMWTLTDCVMLLAKRLVPIFARLSMLDCVRFVAVLFLFH